MKLLYLLLLVFAIQQGSAQTSPEVILMDFVRIKNNYYKEALFYYQNNWKVYRDEALKKGIIQSYQLLSVAADSAAGFHLILITVYKDSIQYKESEAAFASILKNLRPAGSLLLNNVQPGDFRENLYYKAGNTLFAGTTKESNEADITDTGTRGTIISDNLGIVVTQNSTYLLPGQELEIYAMTSATMRSKVQDVSIGGITIPLLENGTAGFKISAGSIGVHAIPVVVSFLNDKGLLQQKLQTVNYTVGQAGFCVALDKMNVLYVGVDNPVTIATAGAGEDKISVSINNGEITKVGAGRYRVRVKTLSDNCVISVYVDNKIVGSAQFRTRYLPLPTATVGGFRSGDSVSAAAFRAQEGVSAYMKDFAFELSYQVLSYRITLLNDKGEVVAIRCQGAAFSPEAKSVINQYAKPGAIVTIDELKVKDAGGREIKLPALLYYIK